MLSVPRIYLFALVLVVLQMCVFPFLNGCLFFSITTLILMHSELGTPINGQHLTLYAIFILYSEFILLSKPHEHLIHYLLYKMPNFIFYWIKHEG